MGKRGMQDKDGSSTNGVAGRRRLPPNARHVRILEILRGTGSLSVTQASADLGVSDMTVRRDLVELEEEGELVRVHGGAMPLLRPAVAVDDQEPVFESRMRKHHGAKLRIARAAAALVTGVRTAVIDVGTTPFLMAQHLPELADTKIFTNSLRVAQQLATPRREIYLAGGKVRGPELAVSGPSAVTQFSELWFDVAVIGTSGITAAGLFDYSFEDTEMKRLYIERSTRKIALCDSSKFQHMSLVKVCALAELTTLVTDAAPPADIAATLEASGVEVIIAGE
jgi:DeoR family glycerol-3-phosphate regulon repressor